MKLTDGLKSWLVEHTDVTSDASDEEFTKAAGMAMASGDLGVKEFEELSTDPKAPEANQLLSLLGKMNDRLDSIEASRSVENKTEGTESKETETKPKEKSGRPEWMQQMVNRFDDTEAVDPTKEGVVRVKGAWERYDTTKTALVHPEMTRRGAKNHRAGQPVQEFGRTHDTPSDRDKALAGAWAKLQIATAQRGGSVRMGFDALPEHDKELLCYLCEKGEWDDTENGKAKTRKGYPGGIKQLIDEAGGSQGLEAVPIVFDDQIIETPLLYGELFPDVNVVPIDRGRRIEGVATGTVTGGWGGVDATNIALFVTTAYISAFDTTIYRWEGAIQIGLDFMSDSPIDFGAHVTRQYGERLLEDLDDVIATGNGTTQPDGIADSAATNVTFGGATNLGNYESLRFAVAKPEHSQAVRNTAVFIGTETSYVRARAIPVGGTDARRIFGQDYDSYSIMGRPFRINESLTNQQILYGILARYRMYRRRGLTVRTSTEGQTLIRLNEMLISVTARFGGQIERGAAFAEATDAPA